MSHNLHFTKSSIKSNACLKTRASKEAQVSPFTCFPFLDTSIVRQGLSSLLLSTSSNNELIQKTYLPKHIWSYMGKKIFCVQASDLSISSFQCTLCDQYPQFLSASPAYFICNPECPSYIQFICRERIIHRAHINRCFFTHRSMFI